MKKPTVADILACKGKRVLTEVLVTDADTARACETAGIDMLITSNAYTKTVRSGAPGTFLTSGLPYGQYNSSDAEAIRAAFAAISDGADAIYACMSMERIRAMSREGIPVIGHCGLVPELPHMDRRLPRRGQDRRRGAEGLPRHAGAAGGGRVRRRDGGRARPRGGGDQQARGYLRDLDGQRPGAATGTTSSPATSSARTRGITRATRRRTATSTPRCSASTRRRSPPWASSRPISRAAHTRPRTTLVPIQDREFDKFMKQIDKMQG